MALSTLASLAERIAEQGSPIARGLSSGIQAASDANAKLVQQTLANALQVEKARSEQSRQRREDAKALQLQTLASTYLPDLASKDALRRAQAQQALAAASLSQGRLADLSNPLNAMLKEAQVNQAQANAQLALGRLKDLGRTKPSDLGPAGVKLYEEHTKRLQSGENSLKELSNLPKVFSKLSRTEQKTIVQALGDNTLDKLLASTNPNIAGLSSSIINSVLPTLKGFYGGQVRVYELQQALKGFLNPAASPSYNANRLNNLLNNVNKQITYDKQFLSSVEGGSNVIEAGKQARQAEDTYNPIPVSHTVADSYHSLKDIGDYYRAELVKANVNPETARKLLDVYNNKYGNSANYRENIKNLLTPSNIESIKQGKVPQDVFGAPQVRPEDVEGQESEKGSALPGIALSAGLNAADKASHLGSGLVGGLLSKILVP